jgi:CRP-like cAMP-binding protein
MSNSATAVLLPKDANQILSAADYYYESPCSSLLTKEENEAIAKAIVIKKYKKGTILQREGQLTSNCFYIFKGCVREYYLMNGEEKTTEFYVEGDSLSSNRKEGKPSTHYWECIEDVTASLCSPEQEKAMYRRFPRLESVCRMQLEAKLGEYQEKIAFYLYSSPQERYLYLLKNRPELLERVPQYQLASYIGVTPESLSRIRGRVRGG